MLRGASRARYVWLLLLIATTAGCSAESQACISERNELLDATRTFGRVTAVAVIVCVIVVALLARPVRPATPGRGLLAVLAAVGATGPAWAFGGLVAERTVDLPTCGLTPFEFGPVLGFVLFIVPLLLMASLTGGLLWLASRLWWPRAAGRAAEGTR